MAPFARFFYLILLAGTLVAAPQWIQAQNQIVDGVAAIVNDEVITISEVRNVVAPREQALRQMLTGQDLIDKVKEARLAALKDLIDRKLVLQEFRKKEFKLPPFHVENQIDNLVRTKFDGDRKAFLKALSEQGVTLAEFREREKERLIVVAMQQARSRNMPLISPKSIEDFYNNNKPLFTSDPKLKLRLIAINNTDDSSREYAEQVRGKLAEGAEFDNIAQLYSEDPSRDLGGDWGWIDPDTLNEKLSKIVFGLPVGKVSKVYEQDGVFYIFLIEEKEFAVTQPLAEVREDIKKKLEEEKRQEMYETWINGLREQAYIKMF